MIRQIIESSFDGLNLINLIENKKIKTIYPVLLNNRILLIHKKELYNTISSNYAMFLEFSDNKKIYFDKQDLMTVEVINKVKHVVYFKDFLLSKNVVLPTVTSIEKYSKKIELEYHDSKMQLLWKKWIDYRESNGFKFKNKVHERNSLKLLMKNTSNDTSLAEKIINDAINLKRENWSYYTNKKSNGILEQYKTNKTVIKEFLPKPTIKTNSILEQLKKINNG